MSQDLALFFLATIRWWWLLLNDFMFDFLGWISEHLLLLLTLSLLFNNLFITFLWTLLLRCRFLPLLRHLSRINIQRKYLQIILTLRLLLSIVILHFLKSQLSLLLQAICHLNLHRYPRFLFLLLLGLLNWSYRSLLGVFEVLAFEFHVGVLLWVLGGNWRWVDVGVSGVEVLIRTTH